MLPHLTFIYLPFPYLLLGLVFPIPYQEIALGKRLQNDTSRT